MARILIAWEYGGGLGHVMALRPIADALRRQGHEVIWVVRDVDRTAEAVDDPGQRLLQAPLFPQRRATQEALNFADVLVTLCYGNTEELGALLQAWLNTCALCRPDLVLTDFAPTALLAARVLAMPSLTIGNGYTLPPRRYPLPGIQPWRQFPPARLAAADALVTRTVNELLVRHGAAPIDGAADIFRCGETILCTFAELDHYGVRSDEIYHGRLVGAAPRPVTSPDILQRRAIFAYLSWQHPWTVPLLKHLAATGAHGSAYVRDAPAGALQPMCSDTFRLSDTPLDVTEALGESRLLISHGGMGTTTQALLAGLPALLLPSHNEQAQFSWRVEKLGAGAMLLPGSRPPAIGPALERALKPALVEASTAFAIAHADFSPARVQEFILSRCLALLDGG